jgi:glycosyltransferase involved in cell wall biosynthesis
MWNLARGLAQIGVKVSVVTTNAKQFGTVDVPRERTEDGVVIHTAPVVGNGHLKSFNRLGLSPGMDKSIFCHALKNDILHLNGFFGQQGIFCAIAAELFNKPLVVSPRGQLDRYSLKQKTIKKTLFLQTAAKYISNQTSAFHFTVEDEKRQAPAWLIKDKGFVVPNPVDFNKTCVSSTFRHKIGVDNETLLLGIFGRIHRKKGFDVIIPALAELKENKLKLVIVGADEGGYKLEVEKMARYYNVENAIIYSGLLTGNAIIEAYSAIDMLVLPSYEENFGNVVVEATSQGTPVIISDQVGLKDWVIENDAGIVLPINSKEWAAYLSGLTREVISVRWNKKLLANKTISGFATERIAKSMLANYEKILNDTMNR